MLRVYAEVVTEVGNRAWVVSAFEWCVDVMGWYFSDGEGLLKVVMMFFLW